MEWGDRYGSFANVKRGIQNFERNVQNRGIRPKVFGKTSSRWSWFQPRTWASSSMVSRCRRSASSAVGAASLTQRSSPSLQSSIRRPFSDHVRCTWIRPSAQSTSVR